MSVFAIDRLAASGINMLIPLGFIVGAPLSGWLVDRVFRGKVTVMILFLMVESAIWLALAAGCRILGQGGLAALLFVMGGACGGLATVLWAWVRDTTPASVMGFTTGLINPSTFVGVAVLQVVTGAILDRVGRASGAYPPAAYQSAFFACFLIVTACLLMTVLLRKRLAGGSARPPAGVSS
jgi:MFS family permease